LYQYRCMWNHFLKMLTKLQPESTVKEACPKPVRKRPWVAACYFSS
jgi:hypothetical protein